MTKTYNMLIALEYFQSYPNRTRRKKNKWFIDKVVKSCLENVLRVCNQLFNKVLIYVQIAKYVFTGSQCGFCECIRDTMMETCNYL